MVSRQAIWMKKAEDAEFRMTFMTSSSRYAEDPDCTELTAAKLIRGSWWGEITPHQKNT
jgi:hypothetical protein